MIAFAINHSLNGNAHDEKYMLGGTHGSAQSKDRAAFGESIVRLAIDRLRNESYVRAIDRSCRNGGNNFA